MQEVDEAARFGTQRTLPACSRQRGWMQQHTRTSF